MGRGHELFILQWSAWDYAHQLSDSRAVSAGFLALPELAAERMHLQK